MIKKFLGNICVFYRHPILSVGAFWDIMSVYTIQMPQEEKKELIVEFLSILLRIEVNNMGIMNKYLISQYIYILYITGVSILHKVRTEEVEPGMWRHFLLFGEKLLREILLDYLEGALIIYPIFFYGKDQERLITQIRNFWEKDANGCIQFIKTILPILKVPIFREMITKVKEPSDKWSDIERFLKENLTDAPNSWTCKRSFDGPALDTSTFRCSCAKDDNRQNRRNGLITTGFHNMYMEHSDNKDIQCTSCAIAFATHEDLIDHEKSKKHKSNVVSALYLRPNLRGGCYRGGRGRGRGRGRGGRGGHGTRFFPVENTPKKYCKCNSEHLLTEGGMAYMHKTSDGYVFYSQPPSVETLVQLMIEDRLQKKRDVSSLEKMLPQLCKLTKTESYQCFDPSLVIDIIMSIIDVGILFGTFEERYLVSSSSMSLSTLILSWYENLKVDLEGPQQNLGNWCVPIPRLDVEECKKVFSENKKNIKKITIFISENRLENPQMQQNISILKNALINLNKTIEMCKHFDSDRHDSDCISPSMCPYSTWIELTTGDFTQLYASILPVVVEILLRLKTCLRDFALRSLEREEKEVPFDVEFYSLQKRPFKGIELSDTPRCVRLVSVSSLEKILEGDKEKANPLRTTILDLSKKINEMLVLKTNPLVVDNEYIVFKAIELVKEFISMLK